ncbi:cation-translocating P-type ATPase [Actibacterium pelagium]|uniref:ATPase n=1 Tax=Actibacterium pelagium TaxID=2029103 RepID=A0A917ANE8_9RHOB|nr:HAD-IC family P-type ATPase [Actibacterium pelagium]GGE61942.1 ATPase [Actibacterium pelagium]
MRPDEPQNQPTGLTSAEAAKRLQKHGPNALAEAKPISVWRILLRQFTGLLVLLLLGAALVALVLGEHVDSIAIGMVVILNGVLGFVQEWRAETALAALRNMLAPKARVIRDQELIEIDRREIVPGDLILLDAGDQVPADARLTTALELRVDESVLTGESAPVSKSIRPDDANNTVMMGTHVVSGRAEAIVEATGSKTAFGKIATLTGSVGEKETNLSRQLGKLGAQLGLVAIGIGVAVALVGVLVGRDVIDMVMTGLSMAVAIVPEGLPAVVTISLALGAAAMVRQKALARRLQAMETLGSASVICTDKTGTLTENMMTTETLWITGRQYDAVGTGYDPTGRILLEGQPIRYGANADLDAALDVMVGCNHAKLRREGAQWQMVGDPTEGALLTFAYKGWTSIPAGPALSEIPFSSARKRMSTVRWLGEDLIQLVKGAPEQVLDVCTHWRGPNGTAVLTDADRKSIETAYASFAERGLRVIALARREVSQTEVKEESLEFIGLVGMVDPPRPEVRAAIQACKSAGIDVIMITGDGPLTARAIAEKLNMPVERTITGAELEQTDDEALAQLLKQPVLFARTSPEHKMRLIRTLQADGQIVAMTGDGVNDAPALKKADIGVAMGTRGTDVAKDAADLVLLDDNFATLERAIREGRRQFANIQRFVRYLLSSNAGEVVAILINLALGGPLIFLPTQILWMNLVTDGVTALMLGLEPGTSDQMTQPPRNPKSGILDRTAMWIILAFGAYTGTASLYLFHSFMHEGEAIARTVAFSGMVLFEKMSVFAFRSFTRPCWKLGWFSNPLLILALVAMIGAQLAAVYWPPLQTLLRTAPLGWEHWQMIALFAIPLVAVPEIIKTLRTTQDGPQAE